MSESIMILESILHCYNSSTGELSRLVKGTESVGVRNPLTGMQEFVSVEYPVTINGVHHVTSSIHGHWVYLRSADGFNYEVYKIVPYSRIHYPHIPTIVDLNNGLMIIYGADGKRDGYTIEIGSSYDDLKSIHINEDLSFGIEIDIAASGDKDYVYISGDEFIFRVKVEDIFAAIDANDQSIIFSEENKIALPSGRRASSVLDRTIVIGADFDYVSIRSTNLYRIPVDSRVIDPQPYSFNTIADKKEDVEKFALYDISTIECINEFGFSFAAEYTHDEIRALYVSSDGMNYYKRTDIVGGPDAHLFFIYTCGYTILADTAKGRYIIGYIDPETLGIDFVFDQCTRVPVIDYSNPDSGHDDDDE